MIVMPTELLEFPLTCLQTAQSVSIAQVIHGKTIVIDFWSTKCTKCPGALDELNRLAEQQQQQQHNQVVEFISICCDSLDGAREMIEQSAQPRWSHVQHYYMEYHYKELAKKLLGFRQVPFYLIVDTNGNILQMGLSKQIDWSRLLVPDDDIVAYLQQEEEYGYCNYENDCDDDGKENSCCCNHALTKSTTTSSSLKPMMGLCPSKGTTTSPLQQEPQLERMLVIDELDF